VEAAASALVTGLGAAAALVKGGHRDGPPDDLLAVRQGGSASFQWLRGERIDAGPVRGTGCVLASAIAAHLACGAALEGAVVSARAFLADALRGAQGRGRRARFLGYGLTPL
jgi:hydroxymethylpyrimidine/phosphomethylpyrimidine kinase